VPDQLELSCKEFFFFVSYEKEEVLYHDIYFIPISLAGIIKNEGGTSRARVNPVSLIINPVSHTPVSNSRIYYTVILDYPFIFAK